MRLLCEIYEVTIELDVVARCPSPLSHCSAYHLKSSILRRLAKLSRPRLDHKLRHHCTLAQKGPYSHHIRCLPEAIQPHKISPPADCTCHPLPRDCDLQAEPPILHVIVGWFTITLTQHLHLIHLFCWKEDMSQCTRVPPCCTCHQRCPHRRLELHIGAKLNRRLLDESSFELL